MHDDVDEARIVDTVTNGSRETDEDVAFDGECSRNAASKRELEFVRESRVPTNEWKQRCGLVPRNPSCVVVNEHAAECTRLDAALGASLAARVPLIPTAG